MKSLNTPCTKCGHYAFYVKTVVLNGLINEGEHEVVCIKCEKVRGILHE